MNQARPFLLCTLMPDKFVDPTDAVAWTVGAEPINNAFSPEAIAAAVQRRFMKQLILRANADLMKNRLRSAPGGLGKPHI